MKQWQLTEKFYVTLEQKRQHYITKESEFLRMKRCKLSVRDFIPLKVIGKSKQTGTQITFLPSKEIFSSIKFSANILIKRMRELAFLNNLNKNF